MYEVGVSQHNTGKPKVMAHGKEEKEKKKKGERNLP